MNSSSEASQPAAIALVGFEAHEANEIVRHLSILNSSQVEGSKAGSWRPQHWSFTSKDLLLLKGRAGEFDALLVFTRLPTWSRLQGINSQGPAAMRSSSFPWGRPGVSRRGAQRLDRENITLTLFLEAAEAFLSHSERTGTGQAPTNKAFLMIYPEDLGDDGGHRPTSVWRVKKLRTLARTHQLQRSAFHQCRHGASRFSRPRGILHSIPLQHNAAKLGWPKHRVCLPLQMRWGFWHTEHLSGPLARAVAQMGHQMRWYALYSD